MGVGKIQTLGIVGGQGAHIGLCGVDPLQDPNQASTRGAAVVLFEVKLAF